MLKAPAPRTPRPSGSKTPASPAKKAVVKLTLERVIGMTSNSNSAIAFSPADGQIAFTAGSIVVLYSPHLQRQTTFFQNKNSRTISCVTFSPDGKYLAAGEGVCKEPEIMIWRVEDG